MQVRYVPGCPACSGAASENFAPDDAARARFVRLSEKKYLGFMNGWERQLSLQLGRCGDCGHIWHLEQPDQASLFGMYAATARRKPPRVGPIRPAMVRHMRSLRRLCAGGRPRLLDYGSGGGAWSAAAREAGFDVVGYEPASERAGSHETVRDLRDLGGERFDAVNLEQVLEHVPDPVETLRALRPLCNPLTVLRITVPNVWPAARRREFWQTFPHGRYMHLLSPYEHLHGFNPVSLRSVLRRSGLIEVTSPILLAGFPKHVALRAIGMIAPYRGSTFAIARFA